jgi:sulfite dehydrogenase (cytochrome) subunit B
MKRVMIAVIIILMALLSGTAYAQDAASKASPSEGAIHAITIPSVRIELKDGEGRVKTETYCNICHSVDYITMQPKFPRSQWTATVNKMIKVFGAPIPPEDAGTIISYLSVMYGTGN